MATRKSKAEQNLDKLADFRNFLFLVWKHLNLPDPTPVQYDIAYYMQLAPRRSIIEAFRGIGKSYIAVAFAVWILLRNPDKKIMVVSASKSRADDFSTFAQRIISEIPICQHLIAKSGQRWSKIAFDVAPAKASGSPSVKSVGVTGQLTGSRADLIIADDIEVPNNSMTHALREKLSESVKEFDAVLKPGGSIMYLGTPQTEMSLYNILPSRGYETRIWPALYPTIEAAEKAYGAKLAPALYNKVQDNPECAGEPVDPLRFDADDLIERELSYGKSGFSLQFMLDTSLSDKNKHPLCLSDLIVYPCDVDTAPEKLIWGIFNQLKELPNVGLNGDRWYAPTDTFGRQAYTGSVMAIDPSGRGKDETSYAIVKMLNGFLHVAAVGGIAGGYTDEALEQLARLAKSHKVNCVLVESNFGDGMFSALLSPYLKRIYPVTMEEVRHNTQKEKRIIDVLEPVMNQHRLVIDPKVITSDFESIQHLPPEKGLKYMLFYQVTRITRERGSLAHDDRLDALSMAVQYWVDKMAVDADDEMDEYRQKLLDEELEKFMHSVTGTSYQTAEHLIKDRYGGGRRR